MKTTVQIQTVLYHDNRDALTRSLQSIANAVRVSRETQYAVDKAYVLWGDAAKEPTYMPQEIDELNSRYAEYVEVKYRRIGQDVGASAGQDMLLEMAQAPMLLVMKPDVVMNPRFFADVLPYFDDARVGITEARQLPVENPKQYDRETGETAWADMACCMVRRRCYEELGGFDAKSFADDGAIDFSWRARMAGWKVLYAPEAFVHRAIRLSREGKRTMTEAERASAAETALLLMYKYQWNAALEETLAQYGAAEDAVLRKVLAAWNERVATGRLPVQLDEEHQVSCWPAVGGPQARFD